MFSLEDKDVSYLLISPEKESNSLVDNKILSDKLQSILYSKEYNLIPVSGYYHGNYEKSFIAICPNDNNQLRRDAIQLMDSFDQECVIVKYKGEVSPKKILHDGSEKLLKISLYNGDDLNKTYLYNGLSFSFLEQRRYQFLNDKSQIKTGMVVEFLNNDVWVEKKVIDVDLEYEKMYRLLMKYGKLRTCVG